MITEEQRKLLEVAADIATIALLLITVAEKLKRPQKKPRKTRQQPHKRKR